MQSSPIRSFDQVVQGNVNIKKLNKKNYKITFSKIGDFLVYQTWSDTFNTVNDSRHIVNMTAKQWVNLFIKYNDEHDDNKFTPTTVMKIGNENYIFVINKVYYNDCRNRVVLKVSTEYIQPKKFKKLPCGNYDNVRFDIDNTWRWSTYCAFICAAVPGLGCVCFDQ